MNTKFDNLSVYILDYIFGNLLSSELINCRCVCKSFKCAIDTIFRRRIHGNDYKYNMNPLETRIFDIDAHKILCSTCQFGTINDVIRIITTYGLTSKNEVNSCGPALSYAFYYKGKYFAEEYVRAIGLKKSDITYEMTKWICDDNNAEYIEWFVNKFDVPEEFFRHDNNNIFQWCCGNGDLESAKWIANKMKFTIDDVMVDDPPAIWLSCETGSLDSLKWLVKKFDLTRDHIMNINGKSISIARIYGQQRVVIWLVETFNLQEYYQNTFGEEYTNEIIAVV